MFPLSLQPYFIQTLQHAAVMNYSDLNVHCGGSMNDPLISNIQCSANSCTFSTFMLQPYAKIIQNNVIPSSIYKQYTIIIETFFANVSKRKNITLT